MKELKNEAKAIAIQISLISCLKATAINKLQWNSYCRPHQTYGATPLPFFVKNISQQYQERKYILKKFKVVSRQRIILILI
jgi:hypothetical protein